MNSDITQFLYVILSIWLDVSTLSNVLSLGFGCCGSKLVYLLLHLLLFCGIWCVYGMWALRFDNHRLGENEIESRFFRNDGNIILILAKRSQTHWYTCIAPKYIYIVERTYDVEFDDDFSVQESKELCQCCTRTCSRFAFCEAVSDL